MWPFRRGPARPAEPAKPAEPARPAKRRISDTAIARVVERRPGGFMLTPLSETPRVERPFEPAKPLTQGAPEMAFDSGVEDVFAQLNSATYNFGEGIGFMGYGYLAELAQRPEYRRGCEVLAREMTRRWIKLTYNGEEDDVEPEAEGDEEDATPGEADKDAEQPEPEARKPDVDPEQADPPGIGHNKPPRPARRVKPSDEKLKRIEAELKRLKVREAFRRVAELDGVFGRGHIYLDTGDTEKPEELRTPLTVSKVKIGRRKKLKRLVVVEPTWTYPQNYDSRDPLKPEFFEPQNWLVMQKSVHASRLLTFVGREVPDMLKPAYSFGGLSLIQMAKPYVDNWLRTRQSVSDILHAFTVWVVKTDLNDILNGSDDGDQVVRRAELFNRVRDNRGLMMVDKESEDFANVSAPLAGLDHLQAQAQEQMASVFAIPLVVLLGITPSGLNASSDGEIRVFYDFIHAFQEHLFGHALHVILKIVQLSLFGEIDEDIGFEFLPLWQPTETDQATIRKTNADIDKVYIDSGVLDPSEVREKIANDKDSPYQNIDPDAVPEPPQPPGGDPFGADPDGEGSDEDDPDDGFPPSSGGGERAPAVPKAGGNPKPPERRPAGGDPKPPRAQDAAFREKDHPRGQPGNAGQFGPGGGKSKTEAPKPKSKEKEATKAAQEPASPRERPPFSEEELSGLPHVDEIDQPATSWEELKTKGEEGRAAFVEALSVVADKLRLRTDVTLPEQLTPEDLESGDNFLFVAPNKSEARARAKIESDYGGNWSKLRDMVRASITVSSMDELRAAVIAAEDAGLALAAKPKDRFTKPTPEGYRDLNTLVRLPNGMVAELQFHLTPIIAAKNEGHVHYEAQQRLTRKNGMEEPDDTWSPEDVERFTQARERQRELYGAAWEKATKA